MVRNGRGFVANIAVLLGIVAGCAVALMMGKTGFEKAAKAGRFDIVTPLAFGLLTFDLVMIGVMTAVMTEAVGMFLARSDITDRPLTQTEMSAGLHTGGLGTPHGGLFNTFRYTRFSQNAGGGGGRYRCQEPPGARGGRRDHDRAGPAAQTALAAVLLNFYFNGGRADTASAIATAKTAQAH